jgi:hypothetical protein
MSGSSRVGWAQLAFISAGGLVWAVRFAAVYSFAALACAKGWMQQDADGLGNVSIFVGAASGAALVVNTAIVVLSLRWLRGGDPREGAGTALFIPYAAAGVAFLSMLAIIWESLVLMLPVCN